jgi:hypothetical protein
MQIVLLDFQRIKKNLYRKNYLTVCLPNFNIASLDFAGSGQS